MIKIWLHTSQPQSAKSASRFVANICLLENGNTGFVFKYTTNAEVGENWPWNRLLQKGNRSWR